MSPWTWLFPRTPVVFSSPLPRDQAVQALRAATARGNLTATGTIAGSVGAGKVLLYHRRTMRNSFKPHFRGRFVASAQGCELRGVFAPPLLVVVFLSFWVGFCLLWTVVSATQFGEQNSLQLAAAIPGLVMAGFGVGLLRLGQHLSADDPAILSRVIRQALQSSSV